MNKKNVSYEDFIEKYKYKKTPDDCYTPPAVYDAVLQWARKHLDIGDRPVVRPFYPGGDFEHFDYPEDCVVIDNPPFSIFTKICNWYIEHNIPFLLFGPGTTSFRKGITSLGISYSITYENGVRVSTSFVTNMMGNLICTTSPDLYQAIKEANQKTQKGNGKEYYKPLYPDNVLRTTMLQRLSRAGIDFQVKAEDGVVVGRATNIKPHEYGSSILLSDRAAAEKLAAEKLMEEKIVAEKLQLLPKSIEIIDRLNKNTR